jgi:hypothetical protein
MWSAVLGFLVTVAYWPGLIDAAKLPREAVVAIGVPLLLRVEPRLMDRRIGWLLLFGVAWAIGGVWARGDVEAGFWLLVLMVTFVAGAGLDTLDGIMTGMALGLAVNSGICIAQLLGWQGVEQNTVPAGLFFSREVLAELAAPVAVWGWINAVKTKAGFGDRRNRFRSVGHLLLVCGGSLPLSLCGERAAIFAAVCGGLYYYVRQQIGRQVSNDSVPGSYGRLHNIFSAWYLVGSLCIVFAGIAAFFHLYYYPERWATAVARFGYWKLTAGSFTLWGHGLGWFRATYPLIDVAHSDVLQMGAELGAGAIFFLAIPVLCLWQRRGTDAERAILVTICVLGVVSFLFELPANGFLAAVVAGFLGGRRRALRAGAYRGSGSGCSALDIGGNETDARASMAFGR